MNFTVVFECRLLTDIRRAEMNCGKGDRRLLTCTKRCLSTPLFAKRGSSCFMNLVNCMKMDKLSTFFVDTVPLDAI